MALTNEQLMELKKVSREYFDRAYAPYSNFPVGAAVWTECGKIIGGCNVENCAFPCGNCAEVVAVNNAVSQGYKRFKAVGITAKSDGDKWPAPCGKCRQVMAEFSLDMDIIVFRLNGEHRSRKLRELLPDAFTPADFFDNCN